MTKQRILQIGSLSGSPTANAELAERYEVLELWKAPDQAAFLREHAQDIEVIATSAVIGCKAEVIAALPKLRAICSWGVGYDTINVEAAHARNILVSNTPDVLNDCVADIAWGLLLACARNIAWGDRFVRANDWENKVGMLPLGTRVSGKKLGGYTLALDNPMADGAVISVIGSRDNGLSWREIYPGDVWPAADLASFGDRSTGSWAPAPVQQVTAGLWVQTIIAPTAGMDLTTEVPIYGSATIEVKYL